MSHFNVSLKIQSSSYRTPKMLGNGLYQSVCGSLQDEQSSALKAFEPAPLFKGCED